jgi:phosphate transport system substrate-binding protein
MAMSSLLKPHTERDFLWLFGRQAILPTLTGCLGLLFLMAMPAHAETLRVGGTGSAIGTLQRLGQAYQSVDPAFQLEVVPNLGSTGGIKALRSGATHIAVVSRPLKPDETSAGLRSIDYGRTPFVLATAKPGVRNLSLREVAEIYAGRRTQWPDGSPVRLVLRPASDGDTTQLASFSDDIQAALKLALAREGMVMAMTDQEAVDAIERLPGGLGTASVALLLAERRRAAPLAIDGVEPTLANVASGRYPHAKTLSLVLRQDASPTARKFVDFVISAQGRKLLAELGHLPPASVERSAAAR